MNIFLVILIILMVILFFWTLQRAFEKFKRARILKMLQGALGKAINEQTDEYLQSTILWYYDVKFDGIFAIGLEDPTMKPSDIKMDNDMIYICKTEKGLLTEWSHEFK